MPLNLCHGYCAVASEENKPYSTAECYFSIYNIQQTKVLCKSDGNEIRKKRLLNLVIFFKVCGFFLFNSCNMFNIFVLGKTIGYDRFLDSLLTQINLIYGKTGCVWTSTFAVLCKTSLNCGLYWEVCFLKLRCFVE